MGQLLQVRGGVEFWECLNCGNVRRILPEKVATIFLVPPEFCSARCRRDYMNSDRSRERSLQDQMTFAEIVDYAVNE
jgi:hypothetical protein